MNAKLFGATLLVLATAFVACKPKEDPTVKVTGVQLNAKATSLDLENDKTVRLTCKLLPSGATGTIAWTSTDTTVATVNNQGLVTAQYYGTTNIIASCEGFSDTCVVKVKTYLQNISFTNSILWDLDTTYAQGKVDTVYIDKAKTNFYRVYKALGTLYVMSDGFYVNSSGYLDGTTNGTMIEVNAPVYYATKYLNPTKGSAVFTLGEWAITNNAKLVGQCHVADPGEIDSTQYLHYVNQWIQGYNTATDAASLSAAYDNLDTANTYMLGTTIYTLTYHSTEEGYPQDGYYNPLINDGVITSGYFYMDNTLEAPSEYMVALNYSLFQCAPLDNEEALWGCNLGIEEAPNYAGVTLSWLDNYLHMGEEIIYENGEMPEDSAPALMPCTAPVIAIDCPQVAANIRTQLQHTNIVTLRRK